ncbi:MAG: hypothetical protein IJU68_00480 [Bacteroidales bacterium]|nr:hypothetical protein [Bacteroidales bacterium]
MDVPFVYSRPVSGRYFVGRREERARLAGFIREGENVVMYEPPRAGKDSLILQTLLDMEKAGEKFRRVYVPLLDVRSVKDVCARLCRALGADESVQDDLKAALELPYSTAMERGERLVVCLDEFQNVMRTEDGDLVLRTLLQVFESRTAEQKLSASYILYGSQVNAMKAIFGRRSIFFRQVQHLELTPMEPKDLVESVERGFFSSGKVMDRGLILNVCDYYRNNIYYLNLLISVCDSLSKGYITDQVVRDAQSQILAIHEPAFRAIMYDLTTFQVSLLRAIAEGCTRFSSSDVIRRYGLNSSANVNRLKDALCKKEIITFDESDCPVVLDPLFERWIAKYYFVIQ